MKEFDDLGLSMPIEQMNHTLTSKKGTVRGLHYQKIHTVKLNWLVAW